MNLYKIARETGTFFKELARADLAYLVVTCAVGPTMLIDMIEYSTARTEEALRRTMKLFEGALKFAEGK